MAVTVTVTPSPTDMLSQQAGVVAAIILIPVIVLGLLLAVLVVTVVVCHKGLCIIQVSCL